MCCFCFCTLEMVPLNERLPISEIRTGTIEGYFNDAYILFKDMEERIQSAHVPQAFGTRQLVLNRQPSLSHILKRGKLK